jgi:quercetin dioxygenase-like cupin family protein
VHGAAVVQLLKGQAHLEIGETSVDVAAGNALTLAAGVQHRLSVPEDALLLLVISNS